jgi:hypothetical protein
VETQRRRDRAVRIGQPFRESSTDLHERIAYLSLMIFMNVMALFCA